MDPHTYSGSVRFQLSFLNEIKNFVDVDVNVGYAVDCLQSNRDASNRETIKHDLFPGWPRSSASPAVLRCIESNLFLFFVDSGGCRFWVLISFVIVWSKSCWLMTDSKGIQIHTPQTCCSCFFRRMCTYKLCEPCLLLTVISE